MSSKSYPEIILKGRPVQPKPYIKSPYQMIKETSHDSHQGEPTNNKNATLQSKIISSSMSPNKDAKIDQTLPLSSSSQSMEEQYERDWSEVSPFLILMVAYLYFIQGIILSIAGTIPFIYPQLPSYSVLSLFALSTLPWAIKFLTAPFVQKFNFPNYGKRKTWVIISQVLTSSLLLVSSLYTQPENSSLFAFLVLVINFSTTLQDISLDALAIKQFRSPSLTSMTVSVFQSLGIVVGGLLLLKLTSDQFAQNYLSRQTHLMDIDTVIRYLTIVVLFPTVLIHFFFQETILDSQIQLAQKSFLEVICYYKIFFDLRSRHCRMSILLLFLSFGWNFFGAGYQYQLIKAGFSKDTLNSIGNLIIIPVSILACPLSKLIPKFHLLNSLMLLFILNHLILIAIYIFFPLNKIVLTAILFCLTLLSTATFLATTMLINSYPRTAVMGMFITMLGSCSNFGQNVAIQTKFLAYVSWRVSALFGLIVQTGILIVIPFYYRWMEKGDFGVNGKIIQNTQNQNEKQLRRDTQFS